MANVTHDVSRTVDAATTAVREGVQNFDSVTSKVGKGIGNGIAALLAMATGGLVSIGDSKKDDEKSSAAEDNTPVTAPAQTELNVEKHEPVSIEKLSPESREQIENVAHTKAFRDAVVALGGIGSAAIHASALEVANRQETAPVISVASPERDKSTPIPDFT